MILQSLFGYTGSSCHCTPPPQRQVKSRRVVRFWPCRSWGVRNGPLWQWRGEQRISKCFPLYWTHRHRWTLIKPCSAVTASLQLLKFTGLKGFTLIALTFTDCPPPDYPAFFLLHLSHILIKTYWKATLYPSYCWIPVPHPTLWSMSPLGTLKNPTPPWQPHLYVFALSCPFPCPFKFPSFP